MQGLKKVLILPQFCSDIVHLFISFSASYKTDILLRLKNNQSQTALKSHNQSHENKQMKNGHHSISEGRGRCDLCLVWTSW